MSSDGTPESDDEVTLSELAALRAGELTAEEEARLLVRMARDPEAADKLWALDNVHRLFEKPAGQADLPTEMPYDVVARLQAHIAEQALGRSETTNDVDHEDVHDKDRIDPDDDDGAS